MLGNDQYVCEHTPTPVRTRLRTCNHLKRNARDPSRSSSSLIILLSKVPSFLRVMQTAPNRRYSLLNKGDIVVRKGFKTKSGNTSLQEKMEKSRHPQRKKTSLIDGGAEDELLNTC